MEMHKILQKDPEIWDHFTRKEEYTSLVLDKYNRFPYYASQNRTIFEPQASEFLIKNGYQAEYPEGKSFAVCLTHDIDGIYQSSVEKSFAALKNVVHGRPTGYSLRQLFRKTFPYSNFESIMKLEEKYNARSSFYFLALEPSDQDFEYRIEDLGHEISVIQEWGGEVGLHPSHQGFCDLRQLIKEKERLERVAGKSVIGCRNHYLNFIVPDTWELLSQAGFTYDCTFGYADCAGFRNGMCHPFKPYNLNSGNIVDIIEIPLVIMDDSLFGTYMRLDSIKAWDITKMLIDKVERCHGVFTVLWHNTSLVGEQTKFYEKILDYCSEKNAWMTSGEKISTWYSHSYRE